MFCRRCGTANTRDSKFCRECGSSMVSVYSPKMSIDPLAQSGLKPEEQVERLLDLAFWHNEAGNTGAALLACQAALALNNRCSAAWSLAGCLYEKKGDFDKAVEAFEMVTSLNPGSIADAQKLEALRRGQQIKAIPQPVVYQWIPPALLRLVRDKPSAKAGLALGASCVILVLGLLAIRPFFSQDMPASAAQPDIAASRSAWASAEQGSVAEDISPAPAAPIRGSMATASAAIPPPQPSAIQGRDPFAGTEPPRNAQPTLLKEKQRTSAHHAWLAPLAVRNLPDLSGVHALGGPAAPAVVATTPSVPNHMVYVGSQPSADDTSPSKTAASSSSGDADAPPPTSHISITVHGAGTSGDAEPIPVDSPSPDSHLTLSASSGAALQQKALNYQEQGDYAHAQAAYKSAISAYRSDLDSGRDSDGAVRGIQACETGLQICRQSQ